MQKVRFICVGKMRESHYIKAFEEYEKRLSAFCDFELAEVREARLAEKPSAGEIAGALAAEALLIGRHIPKKSTVVSLCVEGSAELSSVQFSDLVISSGPGLCFIVGGSNGLCQSVKQGSDLCLSMSKMTFPHHLARVMLIEQLYRAYEISRGGKYHK